MKFSVIIINYNVRAFLENCLLSVHRACESIQSEIIVVDNASDDGSAEMVKQKFPHVKLIVNENNIGFAAANNQALKEAKGEYILLLNPDTILQEDTIRVMVNFFNKSPDVGLAGCKILNPDGTLQLACRRSFPTPWIAFTKITGLNVVFPKSKIFGKYNLAYLSPDETYEVDAVSGSFMFVRRDVYGQVGGLDEQFFMYGEDLDWCFRIKNHGWKIYYVHSTQVIHFKGESVRRSDIDEIKVFHQAMRHFVNKHFHYGIFSDVILHLGIAIREWGVFVIKISKHLRTILFDYLLINISIFLAEYFWFGRIFHFPSYAYPILFTVPAITLISIMYKFGIYSRRKLSIIPTVYSVIIGYIILSALTFFFKQYGFSRMVTGISGILTIVLLPGWRMIARLALRSPEHRKHSIFGRRTLIVGIESSGEKLLRRLRARVDDGYDVIGFVDVNRKRIGEKIAGVEILGSIDNIGKVIDEGKVSEVIFSTNTITYADILSVIGRTKNRSVNFRVVPDSMDVIIGKTHIDYLDDIPLVDIDYNINQPLNRFIKRIFDVAASPIFFVILYVIGLARENSKKLWIIKGGKITLFQNILRGEVSLVGPPMSFLTLGNNDATKNFVYFGKEGITGLVQINYHDELSKEEIEKYNLYYAKNQSLILDIEILLKTIIMLLKHRENYGKNRS
ncbi:MAG: glycosyltransferase [Bacteroidota bacterium]|nr:glycosyltransferase [Bacteroidota bacterium]